MYWQDDIFLKTIDTVWKSCQLNGKIAILKILRSTLNHKSGLNIV